MSKDKIKITYGLAKKTLNRHEQKLLAQKNVHSLGIGEKYVGGKPSGKLCIRVSVKNKGSVKPSEYVPKQLRAYSTKGEKLDGFIETDIIEMNDEFETFGISGNDKIKSRLLGKSGIVYQTAGSQKVVCLTNSHVITPYGQKGFDNPVAYQNKQGDKVTIGLTWRMAPIRRASNNGPVNKVDAALIKVKINSHLLQIRGESTPVVGYGVFSGPLPQIFFYRAGRRKYFCRLLEYRVTPTKVGNAYFNNFFILGIENGIPKPGHSGSLVLRKRNGIRACGLLFGGNSEENLILVFPIKKVLNELGASYSSEDGNSQEDVSISW